MTGGKHALEGKSDPSAINLEMKIRMVSIYEGG
jgi:hypothetical protein